MSEKFIRERHLVELLMQRLGMPACQYLDPHADMRQETGVDVIAAIGGQHIGIQVTELDTGDDPGQSRGHEKKVARDAKKLTGGVYSTWGQNDPTKVLEAICRSISRKSFITPGAGFDEVWLLVSCGVPEAGAVGSSFVMTPWLDVAALNKATLAMLSKSQYGRAFVHAVLGVEKALYQWTPSEGWVKTVQQEPPESRGPSFWDIQHLIRGGS